MKKIKTLTVNGITYAVTDPTAPRIDDSVLGDAPWSAKKIVDTLCPAFTKTGNMITCTPVEGYPLSVAADAEATAITRCGKNLIGFANFSGITGTGNTQSHQGGIFTKTFTGHLSTTWLLTNNCMAHARNMSVPPGTYVFHMNLIESTLGSGDNIKGIYAVVALEDGSTINLKDGEAVTLTQKGAITQFRVTTSQIQSVGAYIKFTLQLEAGSTATAYEPYISEEFAPGESVPALAGINTLWAESGTVTVTGRADPTYAVLETGGDTDGI